MKYHIDGKNGKETNMTEEEIRNLEKNVKSKADEIAASATRKVEPFTRIVTLLGFLVATIFLLMSLIRGSYDGGIRLLFVNVEDTTIMYVATSIMGAITFWHLVSTVRFLANRNKEV